MNDLDKLRIILILLGLDYDLADDLKEYEYQVCLERITTILPILIQVLSN